MHSQEKHIVELDLEFFGKTVKLRCPVENQEKLLIAAEKLKEQFNATANSKMDTSQVVLMTCLKYAFHEEIKKEQIQETITELKQIKKRLTKNTFSLPEENKAQQNNEDESINETKRTESNTQQTRSESASNSMPLKVSAYDNKHRPSSSLTSENTFNNIDESRYGRFIPEK